MKNLDIYILKKFLKTFFFTIMLISVVAIVIDLSERISRMLKNKAPVYDIIFEYYLNFLPWINGLLFPIFVLISVIFFTARMARENEIISIFNAGVSYNRFLRPYMIGAGILAVILYIGGNYIIPKSTFKKNTFENEYIMRGNKRVDVDNVHFFMGAERKAYVRYFRLRDTTMQGFRIEEFKDGKLASILKTDKLAFKTAPNTWTFHGYTKRTFENEQETIIRQTEKIDSVLNFTPKDFIRYTNEMEMMTTPELKEFVAYERSRGVNDSTKHIIEIQRRIADPFSIFIFTLLGVTVASRKNRGGMGLNLAIGVGAGGLFVLIQKFSASFAQGNVISPELGMWIPNIFFGLLALIFVRNAQK